MSQLTINIIGAGAVGQTLARAWVSTGQVRVLGVCNRSLESAERALEWIGEGVAVENIDELGPADYWMVSASDAALADIAQALAFHPALTPDAVLFHCSGLRSKVGVLNGLHPMMSFASQERALHSLKGILCGIEGDGVVFERLSYLAKLFDGVPMLVSSESKPIYHAMAVFSSNYWVTLNHLAEQCAQLAGLDHALSALEPLLRVTLQNVMEKGPIRALSGPIARGDAESVQLQYQALQGSSPHLAQAYAQLGLLTLECAKENLSESIRADIAQVLK